MNAITIENNNTYRSENVNEEGNLNNLKENKVIERNPDHNATKSILLYKNGDKFFPPKRFVVNKRYIRTWDSFLEELTKSIQPRSGAIRDIRTPFHGTRIRSLDDLMINGKYVAVSNGEAMKLIDYTTVIDVTSPASQTKKEFRRLKPLKTINHETEKSETKPNSQLYTKGMVIFIYRNGDPYTRGIKIVLNQFEQKHMSNLVRAIEERVLLQSNKPIRRIYTMEGDVIRFAKDVENGQYYVAASNESFENIKYGQYLPVIRAGKISIKSNDTKGNTSQKPKTSRTQKKDVSKELDEREVAALKIQAAFRSYLARNAINRAQENQDPMPTSRYKSKPRATKPNNPQIENPKPEMKRNLNSKKENTEKPKEKTNSNEKKKVVEKNAQNKTKNEVKDILNCENNEYSEEELSKRTFAAQKIQAGFRGFLIRKQLNSNLILENVNVKNEILEIETVAETEEKEIAENEEYGENEVRNDDNIYDDETETEKAAIIIQNEFRYFKSRKAAKKQEESRLKEEAAKVIQSGYRGYMIRKKLQDRNENERRNKAAAVIQASYRGFVTRRAINVVLPGPEKTAEEQALERNRAASKIQAAFRGYSTRVRI